MEAKQERGKPVKRFLDRLRGMARICDLTMKCTKENCDEMVSIA